MSAQVPPHGMRAPRGSELHHSNISISPGGSRMVARLLATATSALEADRLTARTCIQRAAALLGVELDQSSREPPPQVYLPRGCLAPWQAEIVNRYIEENLSSRIRVSTLAHMVQLSLSHFFRAFRCTFSDTPRSYIEKWRVLRGQQLIVNSGLSLAQIALEIGMCDQPHFCRTFRRVVGVNPKTWRRQNLRRSGRTPAREPSDPGEM
jgi:AraC family transcriptional regulator